MRLSAIVSRVKRFCTGTEAEPGDVAAECHRIQRALDLRRLEAARAVLVHGERAVADFRWHFHQAAVRQDWDAVTHYDDLTRMADAYLPARGTPQLERLVAWLAEEAAPARLA